MLFLLRRIRKALLTKNRFTTYLLYAIGEILLVVVGILIAVSIDDWNQQRTNRILEIKYLKELESNLQFDLLDIQFNLDFNISRKNSNELIIRHLNSDGPYADSLDFHLSNLVFSTRTLPKTTAFESLASKGLEIITNDSLRSEISRMYSVTYLNAIDFETKDDHVFQYQILWPEVMDVIELDSLGKSAKPINYAELKKNVRFKNGLVANLTYREYMIDTYTSLKMEVSNLIIFIQRELNRLEN